MLILYTSKYCFIISIRNRSRSLSNCMICCFSFSILIFCPILFGLIWFNFTCEQFFFLETKKRRIRLEGMMKVEFSLIRRFPVLLEDSLCIDGIGVQAPVKGVGDIV